MSNWIGHSAALRHCRSSKSPGGGKGMAGGWIGPCYLKRPICFDLDQQTVCVRVAPEEGGNGEALGSGKVLRPWSNARGCAANASTSREENSRGDRLKKPRNRERKSGHSHLITYNTDAKTREIKERGTSRANQVSGENPYARRHRHPTQKEGSALKLTRGRGERKPRGRVLGLIK